MHRIYHHHACYPTPQLLPNPARLHRRHRLPRLAAECLAEVEVVRDYSIDPELRQRMRICKSQLPLRLGCFVLAPDLAEAEEEALGGREAVQALLGLAGLVKLRKRTGHDSRLAM